MFLTINVTPASSASATINLVRRGGIGAPEMVIMDATLTGFDTAAGSGTYNPQDHEVYYFWDVGEDSTYTAPVNLWSGSDRHTNGHKNARYSYSPTLMHVFNTAGAKTITLTVFEPSSGKSAVATYNLTVGDPDAVFPTTQTIYMSTSGTFTTAPSGARQITGSSINTVVGDWVDGQETTAYRIILRQGETFTWSQRNLGSVTGGGAPSFTIVGEGSGATVTLSGAFRWQDPGSTEAANSKSFTLDNLTITGSPAFNSQATGLQSAPIVLTVGANGPGQCLINRCTISDVKAVAIDETGGDGHGIVICNTVSEGHAYGALLNWYDYFGCLGSRILSDVTAWVDANDTPSTNGKGWGLRCGGQDSTTVIHSNDIFTRQGWSSTGHASIAIAVQPCLRLNPLAPTGASYFVFANNFEGGRRVINTAPSDGPANVEINCVFDMNYVLGSYSVDEMVHICTSGMTIRNNLFNIPDVQGNGDEAPTAYLSLGGNFVVAEDRGKPIRIYSNTYRNGMTNAVQSNPVTLVDDHFSTPFTDVVHNNWIEHQPLQTSGNNASPLGDDTNVFTPRELGYQTSTVDLRSSTFTKTTAGNTDLFDPETGQADIGAASSGLVSYRDFRGLTRSTVLSGLTRSVPSKGHIEPTLES